MTTTQVFGAVATAILAVVSLTVSVLAVLFNKRQVDVAARALAQPFHAGLFSEFRSHEFRTHLQRVRQLRDMPALPAGFEGLPEDIKDSAYSVCYFFEYMGIEIAFGHVAASQVIGTMASHIVEMWLAMGSWIAAERNARRSRSDIDQLVSPLFLPFYENLVVLVEEAGGRRASAEIHKELGLRQLAPTDPLHPDGSTRQP